MQLSAPTTLSLGGYTVWQRQFDASSFQSNSAQAWQIAVPESLQQASSKRRAEFVAGRVVARDALVALKSLSYHVSVGEQRAPQWPSGWLGSISHTDHTAVCVAKQIHEHAKLGVDIERVVSERAAKEIMPLIFVTPQERALVASADWPIHRLVTLIFSAKESLFKAIYPTVGRYLEFSHSCVEEMDLHRGKVTLQLCRGAEQNMAQKRFTAFFHLHDDSVVTLVSEND
ncbi:4'-phosphopantetheinyl transferase family protein [Vibrio metschnikovii]|uniref:4'-phosphopantetheinyl transferase family protein n=1 Tax=Vibrio metschnikovii TaxID=28172 RepID=UPI001C2FBE78|nr:4'-phosphopantetheinyl transferase superfamily protein [Vibrio metschnikovii]